MCFGKFLEITLFIFWIMQQIRHGARDGQKWLVVLCHLSLFMQTRKTLIFKILAVIYLDFWFVTCDGEIDFEEFIRMMRRTSYGY